jgi:UDP-N-acetylmuramate--alanine ligase
VNHAGTTARLGRSDYMVVEADESDRSFLLLARSSPWSPTIDREHLDHYASLEEIQEVFVAVRESRPLLRRRRVCASTSQTCSAILPRVTRPVDHLRHRPAKPIW